jgi:dienelactone hydrolase
MRSSPFSFKSQGQGLAGRLTLPIGASRAAPVPLVVTAPGFGGVKEMLIPAFSKALAGAGVGCLAFDYAGFGESEGSLRQHVDPQAQRRAYIHALDAIETHPGVDAERLGVWGTSFSGAHSVYAAAEDPRVRCAVAIVPFMHAPLRPDFRLMKELVVDVARRSFGLYGRMIASSGPPGSRAIMTTDGASAWIEAVTRDAPSYRNEVTVASLWEVARYRAVRPLREVRVPLRLILATHDAITPAQSVHAVLRGRDLRSIDVVEYPESHFEIFGEHLPGVIAATVEWLALHLRAG